MYMYHKIYMAARDFAIRPKLYNNLTKAVYNSIPIPKDILKYCINPYIHLSYVSTITTTKIIDFIIIDDQFENIYLIDRQQYINFFLSGHIKYNISKRKIVDTFVYTRGITAIDEWNYNVRLRHDTSPIMYKRLNEDLYSNCITCENIKVCNGQLLSTYKDLLTISFMNAVNSPPNNETIYVPPMVYEDKLTIPLPKCRTNDKMYFMRNNNKFVNRTNIYNINLLPLGMNFPYVVIVNDSTIIYEYNGFVWNVYKTFNIKNIRDVCQDSLIYEKDNKLYSLNVHTLETNLFGDNCKFYVLKDKYIIIEDNIDYLLYKIIN